MRRIANRGRAPRELWLTELDQALAGAAKGPAAESWRELRGEVRSLAPPMAPDFADRLERGLAVGPAAGRTARREGTDPKSGRRSPSRALAWIRGRTGAGGRPSFGHLRLGASGAAILAVVAALLLVGPWRSTPTGRPGHAAAAGPRGSAGPAITTHEGPAPEASGAGVEGAPGGSGAAAAAPSRHIRKDFGGIQEGPAEEAEGQAQTAAPLAPATSGGAAGGRLQQLAAAIGLTTSPGQVQSLSDRVERLATNEGGYVESSQVQTQSSGRSEATIILRVPSAALSATVAALQKLGKVSSENQSSQDITGSYNAARAGLRDARAEHGALLRALAAATTEREIESLQRRLARSRRTIERASAQVQAVAHRARMATAEVTVTGSRQATTTRSTHGSQGLTLGRGARKALDVLTVVVVVLLVAAAILLPLSLLVAMLLAGYGAWRRHQRERVLDPA